MRPEKALQSATHPFRQGVDLGGQHAAQAEFTRTASARFHQRQVFIELRLRGLRGVDAANGAQGARAVSLDSLIEQVVLARKVIVDAGRLHAHVLGQVAVAEAVASAGADQLLGVGQKQFAGSVGSGSVHG
ncbi:hypothetical protein FQZ97_818600 [compost metagenome]